VPLPETPDDLALRGADRALMQALADELGDASVLDRVRYRT